MPRNITGAHAGAFYIRAQVRGQAAMAARIFRFERDVLDGLIELNRQYSRMIEDRTQELVPIDTRFMHDHVRTQFSKDMLEFTTGWFADDFNAARRRFYPPFVEHGTRRHAAQPSLGPAHAEIAPRYALAVQRMIRRAIAQRRISGAR